MRRHDGPANRGTARRPRAPPASRRPPFRRSSGEHCRRPPGPAEGLLGEALRPPEAHEPERVAAAAPGRWWSSSVAPHGPRRSPRSTILLSRPSPHDRGRRAARSGPPIGTRRRRAAPCRASPPLPTAEDDLHRHAPGPATSSAPGVDERHQARGSRPRNPRASAFAERSALEREPDPSRRRSSRPPVGFAGSMSTRWPGMKRLDPPVTTMSSGSSPCERTTRSGSKRRTSTWRSETVDLADRRSRRPATGLLCQRAGRNGEDRRTS